MTDDGVLAGALAALARGEKEAMAVIYDAVGRDLYGLALWRTGNSDDAADSVQEVFVRLASTRADLHTVKNPRAYLMGMAHRASVDIFRARRRTAPLDEAMLLDGGAGPESAWPRGRRRWPWRSSRQSSARSFTFGTFAT